MFERWHSKSRKISLKQHIKYFNFRSKIQMDHPVTSVSSVAFLLQFMCNCSYLWTLSTWHKNDSETHLLPPSLPQAAAPATWRPCPRPTSTTPATSPPATPTSPPAFPCPRPTRASTWQRWPRRRLRQQPPTPPTTSRRRWVWFSATTNKAS